MSACRIAVSPTEASAWTGAALVIDVIRFSATMASLAQSGRKTVRIHPSPASLIEDANRFPEADIFSEMDLGPGFPIHDLAGGPAPDAGLVRFDNSPFAARDRSRAYRAALVATGSGSRAMMSLAKTCRILVGGFCNFASTLTALAGEKKILLAPAALWLDRPADHGGGIEDFACAEAYREALEDPDAARPDFHLRRIRESERPAQFRSFRPRDAGRDLDLCLNLDTIPATPSVRIEEGAGILVR